MVEARPHGRAHHNLAVELAAQGRRDDALTHYRIATADVPAAHYAVGFELAERGQVDEAIVELRQFIARKPNDSLMPRAYTPCWDCCSANVATPPARSTRFGSP